MFKRLYTVFLFIIFCNSCIAQLRINYNGKDILLNNRSIRYALVQDNHFTTKALFSIADKDWHSLHSVNIKLNKLSTSIWLKIPVNEILQYGDFNYLKINNPHINYLKCWIISDTKVVKEFTETGDNNTFDTRTLPVTTYDFPIHGKDFNNCYIIIVADKRFTNLALPIDFFTENFYISNNENASLTTGLIAGIIILILFLNISLYIILKQPLFNWYSLYQFFILVYLLSDKGILFKFLYPHAAALNDLVRPLSLSFCIIPLIQFFNRLLELDKTIPKIYQLNKWISGIYGLLFIIATFSSSSSNYAIQGGWLQVSRILSPALLCILLYESFYCYYKKIQYASFALLSYTGTTLFIIIFSLHQSDLVSDSLFTSYANYWAIFWELIIMCFALIWRYKFYKLETETLARANREQQEKIFTETVIFQEKEMQRISSLLHDSVGANLGLLRLEADKMKLTENGRQNLAKNITKLGNEVRMMSHTFSPILLQEKGLYLAIKEMANRIKTNSDIDLQFEWIGEHQPISSQFEIVIYRITQEILQNLLKHAQAKSAFLQIMITQYIISIYAEDDGIGIPETIPTEGIGLKSIQKLINLLNGRCEIKSNYQEGFSISIEFNQIQHEKM